MTKVPNKIQMPTAITDRTQMKLNITHPTTTSFMSLGVAGYYDVVPNQKVDVSHKVFIRANPMPIPTFGDCYVHNRAFFVPYRTVCKDFLSFISDVPNSSDSSPIITSLAPQVKNSDLAAFFLNRDVCSYVVDDEAESDFVVINVDGSVDRRNFNPFGSRCFKLLTQLGYVVNFNLRAPDVSYCALAILCLARAYYDWYYPSVYSKDLEAQAVESIFYRSSGINGFSLSYIDLSNIFTVIDRVCYDADYYTAAWDNPVSPTDGTYSNVLLKDITHLGDPDTPVVISNERSINGTPTINRETAGYNAIYQLSQYATDALKSLTDYVKRHQISGARVLDRYRSRFGITLESAILDRSIYCGIHTGRVEFGNVTSTADTDDGTLGSYAGIGIGGSDGRFTYQSDEYGLFFIISTVVPEAGYFQGVDRMNLHLSKLDFYTPEFDNLGVQALATAELYVPMDSRKQFADGLVTTTDPDYNALVFGFVPRYAEYKRGKTILSGDYRLNSRNAGKDAWYLFRDLDPFFASVGVANGKHSVDFIQSGDADQYGRIFYNTDSSVDQFNVLHLMSNNTLFPGKSLYDTYEFEDEDKAQKVSTDLNGVKAN